MFSYIEAEIETEISGNIISRDEARSEQCRWWATCVARAAGEDCFSHMTEITFPHEPRIGTFYLFMCTSCYC